MKSIQLFISIFLLTVIVASGQTNGYTSLNSHSHNDYLDSRPFWNAYEHRFGSIEADIHLVEGKLFVAHDYSEIEEGKTFEKLYLEPIAQVCLKNEGLIYEDKSKKLVLLVDLKTPYKSTLATLIKALEPYREYLYPKGTVQIVVSGNTPPPNLFSLYPNFIYFDGRPSMAYSIEQLKRIGMISQSFKMYSSWKGEGDLSINDRTKLEEVIKQIHKLNKPMRFWATPDTPLAWKTLMELKLNYINTDKIEELSAFITNNSK